MLVQQFGVLLFRFADGIDSRWPFLEIDLGAFAHKKILGIDRHPASRRWCYLSRSHRFTWPLAPCGSAPPPSPSPEPIHQPFGLAAHTAHRHALRSAASNRAVSRICLRGRVAPC